MSKPKKIPNAPVLKRVLKYLIPYKGIFFFTALLTIILSCLGTIRPKLIQYTIDEHIIGLNKEGLLNMTLIIVGILIVQAFFEFYHTYLANWIGQTIIKDLRIQTYKHVNNFKLKYFDTTPIGTIITRVVSDIEKVAEIFSQGILVIIGDILKLILVLVVMFYTDWKLALVSLSVIPILLVATNIFKNGIKASYTEVRKEVSNLNAFVQEHIIGMNIVQIFNKEEEEFERFKIINEKHKKAHVKSVWHFSIFLPVAEVLSAVSLGLLVWWVAKDSINNTTSLGRITEFIMYIFMLFRPIRMLADKFNVLQMGVIAANHVFNILDSDLQIENQGNITAENIQGDIEFKDVWFAYNNEDWVLKNINFTASKGETIALVGATGSGKSSIINLLSRFYSLNKGDISVDGSNLKTFNLQSLRRNIAVVLQDVFLFSDSIHNNITLNDDNISREEVIKAAKLVGADSFIQKLPGGYDYNVKERGAMLSVGQRQLISFIRAYVFNPKILILDEATSSIDSESEQLIQQATDKITEGRTSIIVAHRLSTIQKADKIIVLDKGEIKEIGNHQELLAQNGFYKKLYDYQFKNDN